MADNADKKVNRNNYITIQGWMVSELELKGNELLIYAIIYGFSQNKDNRFTGSLAYLAAWTNSTKQGVSKCLKSLCEKGLIDKKENVINGVKFCEYRATEFNMVCNKVVRGMQQSLTGGMQQSLTNINNIDIDNNNIVDKKESKQASDSFDCLISDYSKGDKEITELLQEWLKVRKAKRAAMTNKAIELNLNKLDRLAKESRMSVPDYLREVICRGWQAFYPITSYQQQRQQRQQGSNVFLDIAKDEGIF